jgi:hypothetical protein
MRTSVWHGRTGQSRRHSSAFAASGAKTANPINAVNAQIVVRFIVFFSSSLSLSALSCPNGSDRIREPLPPRIVTFHLDKYFVAVNYVRAPRWPANLLRRRIEAVSLAFSLCQSASTPL